MAVLITGAGGFIGGHLARELRSRGLDVYTPLMDVTDADAVRSNLEGLNIDVVLHLAAISSVPHCEKERDQAFLVNVMGAYEVASFVSKANSKAHFIFLSSGQVYSSERPEGAIVFYEDSPVLPRNFYGLTKFLAEEALKVISQNTGLDVTIIRLFNHSHKSQSPDFFLPSVYRQLASVVNEVDGKKTVSVGSVDVDRDIGAIQDLLEALVRVVTQGPVDRRGVNIFNLASATPKRLRSLVEMMAKKMKVDVSLTQCESLKRLGEPKSILANCDKFKRTYQWSPQFSSSEEDLVNSFLSDL